MLKNLVLCGLLCACMLSPFYAVAATAPTEEVMSVYRAILISVQEMVKFQNGRADFWGQRISSRVGGKLVLEEPKVYLRNDSLTITWRVTRLLMNLEKQPFVYHERSLLMRMKKTEVSAEEGGVEIRLEDVEGKYSYGDFTVRFVDRRHPERELLTSVFDTAYMIFEILTAEGYQS